MNNIINTIDNIQAGDTDDEIQPISYIAARAAGWVRNLISTEQRVDRHTLSVLFWLTGGDAGRWQAMLSALLTAEEQERFGPELHRSWGDHEDTGDEVWTIIVRSLPGRRRRVLQSLPPLLDAWIAEGLQDTGARLAGRLVDSRGVLGLTEDEAELCFFLAAMKWYEPLMSYFDRHLDCYRPQGQMHVQAALGWTADRLAVALDGKPHRVGIIDLCQGGFGLDSGFVPFFVEAAQAPDVDDLFRAPPRAGMSADSLGVSNEDLEVLRACLTAEADGPLHVLLYGPPGTGKTTLARALVEELGLDGLEAMGIRDNLNRSRRASLAVCMELARSRRRSVVLVDEADRVLSTVGSWSSLGEASDKGWLTRLMDESPARTIWVVNDRDDIDPAVLRRFALSVELRKPGVRQRATIIRNIATSAGLAPWPDHDRARALAEEFDMVPAIYATAAATAARAAGNGLAPEVVFRQALKSKQRLMRLPVCPMPYGAGGGFLEEGVNPRRGLGDLVSRAQAYDSLWRREDAGLPPLAMLFHGDPGTGKSETARYLARVLDRPVCLRRASDLLGMYVGQTEKAIAAAFAEAAADGAVLVLDEVDSFLQTRARAQRSWEVSMVNEMLVQIESHRGLVIVTTNRRDDLDAAALRRFAVKEEFLALSPHQVVALYVQLLLPLASGPLGPSDTGRLRCMTGVTASDMALVRRNRMLTAAEPAQNRALVAELEQEVGARAISRPARVGFAIAAEPILQQARREAACL